MAEDRSTWIRQSCQLALVTAGFHVLQFLASAVLWTIAGSASLGLSAWMRSSARLLRLSSQLEFTVPLRRLATTGVPAGRQSDTCPALQSHCILLCLNYGGAIWSTGTVQPGDRGPMVLGIVLAAVSMLVIPIVGSYMKVLAVELRSQPLKAAAIFTFGNSYLSMVLLVALLINAGMGFRWGDAAGGLVMFPFLAQKGLQILIDEGKQEYVEE